MPNDPESEPPPRVWKSVEYLQEQRAHGDWKRSQTTLRMTLTTCVFGAFVAWFYPVWGVGLIAVAIYGFFWYRKRKF